MVGHLLPKKFLIIAFNFKVDCSQDCIITTSSCDFGVVVVSMKRAVPSLVLHELLLCVGLLLLSSVKR